jgi:hypothetical protein
MTWLGTELGVSRTYLSDAAAGRRKLSPALLARIDAVLEPGRLDAAMAHAQRRRWALGSTGAVSAAILHELPELEPERADQLAETITALLYRSVAATFLNIAGELEP